MTERVWVVSSYDKGGNAGFVIEGIFTTKEAAEEFVAQDPQEFEAEEYDLLTIAPSPWTYWHRGADVYPDGSISEWKQKHTGLGPVSMAPVDDHMKPWDGHSQGHCGLHISIFGTDIEQVEAAFQRQLTAARAQCNGICPCCGSTGLYKAGFWGELRERRGANAP